MLKQSFGGLKADAKQKKVKVTYQGVQHYGFCDSESWFDSKVPDVILEIPVYQIRKHISRD